ncbi:putative selenium-dependent hydroxylase accessory protein YqeC [bacterium]|nr:putative selenium-dependent hydroxylase accessory protein YqeC [bacterium]
MKKVAGVILAAGKGLRMGQTKQLLPFLGIPVLQGVINTALASELDDVIVVLGYERQTIRKAVDLSGVIVVENVDYHQGQAGSLKAGIRALPPASSGALFLLGDQPLVDVETINHLIHAYQAGSDLILRPAFAGKPGNPTLMDRAVFPQLLAQSGDLGGRGVFRYFSERTREVPVQQAGIHFDLDTPADYAALLNQLPSGVADPASPASGGGRWRLLERFHPKKNSVIAFVGAGGKTSALFAFAGEMKEKGFHVLVTTTTAMFHPDRDGWPYDRLLIGRDISRLIPPVGGSGSLTITAAVSDPESGKIRGFTPEVIDAMQQQAGFDMILVEADGSRGCPLKAPAPYEPVLPASTRTVFGVIGLDSLGKPLDEKTVHRSLLFSQLTGLDLNQPVSQDAIQILLVSPRGLFKDTPPTAERIVILNKADTPERLLEGCRIAYTACRRNSPVSEISRVLVCEMRHDRPVLVAVTRSTTPVRGPGEG